jgi:hypothetical protein
MENKELREKITEVLLQKMGEPISDNPLSHLEFKDVHNETRIKIVANEIFALLQPNAGQELYMDLCGRLIKRILEFNSDEHDIELNLCGIIEKAKILGNNTCMCMDCGKVFNISEQSKHLKECKKDHSLKPQ